jgi:excisionase family DNA binding protein
MTTEPWVFVEQVAQHLGVAKDIVYSGREHRGVPTHRVGRLWKLKLSGVDNWVRAGARMKNKGRAAPTPARTEGHQASCPR